MMGRTHGVHAEPMTFGLKLALWYAEVQRDIVRVRRAREAVERRQDLRRRRHVRAPAAGDRGWRVRSGSGSRRRPIATQVIQRDRHAELMTTLAITAASLEKFALEIRGLQKTEVGEVEEPFGKGQKGSSAMPHKRNPVGCEQVVRPGARRARPTPSRRSRTSRSGTNATSRTRRSSASSCPTASSRSTT